MGGVRIPGSKSVTNRALLLAAQAQGTSRFRGGLDAEDTRVFRRALRTLGIPVTEAAGAWEIRGGAAPVSPEPLWLGASGTSLRFLLPWLALQAQGPVDLTGEPRLFERPLGPLISRLEPLGARWEPLPTGGRLHPAPAPPRHLDLECEATLSSQFLSGLALAAAGLPEGGRLRWTGKPASPSYLTLTAAWLSQFGCPSHLSEGSWEIPGGRLRPASLTLPADWSGAAAFLCAAAVTGRAITIAPLDPGDGQGDHAIVEFLCGAGCTAHWDGPALTLAGPLTRGLEADLTTCPDLAPVLAATAALAPGTSRLSGLDTLPLKECDRLEASVDLVRWLGGEATAEGTCALTIHPGALPPHDRPPFDPRRDHRMAFAAAVGALRCGGALRDPDSVAKTFPTFWEVWEAMLQGSPA